MKHIYTFLLMCASTLAFAQCVPVTSITTPGTYPSVLTVGCQNTFYSDTVTLAYPADTVVFAQTIPFDSFIVVNVLNLPAGLTYSCGSSNCTTVCNPPLMSYECILVDGTPTGLTAPNAQFDIVVLAWLTVFASPVSLTDTIHVELEIDACLGITSNSIAATQIYPNPAQDQLNINLAAGQLSAGSKFTIYNAVGQTAISSTLTAEQSVVSLVGLTEGIYFVTLENEEGVISRERLVIRK